jgi:DNA-binding response OmpR family regulator
MTGIQESSIVIVEDNKLLQESILELLALHGFHNVSAFSDALNAVSFFRQSHPDLAILDVEMAGMNGLDLLVELKSMRPRMPVVMMSSCHDKSLLLKACESGASTFFPKPFDTDMFCQKIEALLKKVDFYKD